MGFPQSSSQARAPLKLPPIRASWPGGVNSTKRVSLSRTLSSIQRCVSPNGWSLITVKPTFSVQKARARSWSRLGMLTNLTWVIMRGPFVRGHLRAAGGADKQSF